MDVQLNDLQTLLRDNAQKFLEREAPPARARAIEAAGEHDPDLWRQIVALGWTGLSIAETHGGEGGTLLDLSVLLEQLSRHAVLTPLPQTLLSAAVIERHADHELAAALLPRVIAGLTITPALLEGEGTLRGAIATVYEDGRVSGTKRFVEHGRTSDVYLVAAVSGGEPGLALVPLDQPAVSQLRLVTTGGLPQATVRYDGATAEGWIDGAEAVEYLRLLGSALAAFECYAHAQKALDMAVDYVQIRVQFGRPIGSFEAVQQRCADIATLVEASRFLTRELLYHFDQDSVDPAQVARVKAIAARAVTETTMWAHVLHGGVGFMAEYDLQFHTRRGKEAALRWGTPRECLNVVAATTLG